MLATHSSFSWEVTLMNSWPVTKYETTNTRTVQLAWLLNSSFSGCFFFIIILIKFFTLIILCIVSLVPLHESIQHQSQIPCMWTCIWLILFMTVMRFGLLDKRKHLILWLSLFGTLKMVQERNCYNFNTDFVETFVYEGPIINRQVSWISECL